MSWEVVGRERSRLSHRLPDGCVNVIKGGSPEKRMFRLSPTIAEPLGERAMVIRDGSRWALVSSPVGYMITVTQADTQARKGYQMGVPKALQDSVEPGQQYRLESQPDDEFGVIYVATLVGGPCPEAPK